MTDAPARLLDARGVWPAIVVVGVVVGATIWKDGIALAALMALVATVPVALALLFAFVQGDGWAHLRAR